MFNTTPNYARRRLIATALFTALAVIAGFAWGYQYGYNSGKGDTIKQIKRRVDQAPVALLLLAKSE
jgi:ABC-type dipeptide/oligopeptide/nickel transport system permease subunit